MTATAWWGLRAYSAAKINTVAIRLRRDSDNAEQDFKTIPGGGLDLDLIRVFKGSANLYIVKMYDQTGNGWDMPQSTAAQQPALILNGLGSMPVIRSNIAASTGFQLISGPTLSQPFTYSYSGKRTGSFTSSQDIYVTVTNQTICGWYAAANTIRMYAGINITGTASDNNFHAVQNVLNGASSDLNIDGVSSGAVNPGSSGASGITDFIRPDTFPCEADVVEFGVWNAAFSTAQSSNMNTNQRSYWGF